MPAEDDEQAPAEEDVGYDSPDELLPGEEDEEYDSVAGQIIQKNGMAGKGMKKAPRAKPKTKLANISGTHKKRPKKQRRTREQSDTGESGTGSESEEPNELDISDDEDMPLTATVVRRTRTLGKRKRRA
jgi:hypothetical protein